MPKFQGAECNAGAKCNKCRTKSTGNGSANETDRLRSEKEKSTMQRSRETKDMAKTYHPKAFEDRIYAEWEEKHCGSRIQTNF